MRPFRGYDAVLRVFHDIDAAMMLENPKRRSSCAGTSALKRAAWQLRRTRTSCWGSTSTTWRRPGSFWRVRVIRFETATCVPKCLKGCVAFSVSFGLPVHACFVVSITAVLFSHCSHPTKTHGRITIDGKTVSAKVDLYPGENKTALTIDVEDPQLWWPIGFGDG